MSSIVTIKLRDQFLAGDDNAYAGIYKLYAKELYAFGLSVISDKELIEDAIHDVFTDIYTRKELLRNVNNLKIYFIIAFRNRLFFLLRKKKKENDVYNYVIDEFNENAIQEEWMDKEEDNEKLKQINSILEILNPHQREIIYHRYIDGLSCKDISKIMGINYQSVKNLLYRSIKKIKLIKTTLSLFFIIFSNLIN